MWHTTRRPSLLLALIACTAANLLAVPSVSARASAPQTPPPNPQGYVFQYGEERPVVICAVNNMCDIALQPGERLHGEPFVGDPRFRLFPSVTGKNGSSRLHVLVQPAAAGIQTTLTIHTDRRAYHIELRSHATQYMAAVQFAYPEEIRAVAAREEHARAEARQRETLPTGEYLGELDFNYSVTGAARWRPVRVYSKGQQTIIQMGSALDAATAPALLILKGSELMPATSVAPFRLVDDRYEVDLLFTRAALVSGSGDSQQSVTIQKENR